MTVTLYTTDCPKCRVLESKLKAAGIQYETKGESAMIAAGLLEAPILALHDTNSSQWLGFADAVKWVNLRAMREYKIGGDF